MLLFTFTSFALATQAWASTISHPTSIPPTVDLGYATYTGTHLPGASQNEFLGIRFGAAPVGDLRFRAPQPPPQQGHQNATAFPPLCYGVGMPVNETGRSEDCLFLSVYAPSDLGNEKVPVLVFIQGGGFSDDTNGNVSGNVRGLGDRLIYRGVSTTARRSLAPAVTRWCLSNSSIESGYMAF